MTATTMNPINNERSRLAERIFPIYLQVSFSNSQSLNALRTRRVASKRVLQAELNLPRTRACGQNLACGGVRSAIRGKRSHNRTPEISTVEQVEQLRAKLELAFFRHRKRLEQREVKVDRAGTDQRVPSQGSKKTQGRGSELAGVKILVRAAQHRIALAAG